MFIYKFFNGAIYLRFNDPDDGFVDRRCYVLLPPGFAGKTIPNKHIHEPEWNAKPVNDWWAGYRSRECIA